MIFRNCCSLVPPGRRLGLVLAQRADEVVRVVADRLVGRDVLDRRAAGSAARCAGRAATSACWGCGSARAPPPTRRRRSRLSGIERDSTGVPVRSAAPIGGSVLVSSADGVRRRRASSVESSRKPRLARRLVVPCGQRARHPLDRGGQRGGVAVERRERVGAVAQRRGGGGRHRRHLRGGARRARGPGRPRRVRRSDSVGHHRGQASQQRRARGDRLVQRLARVRPARRRGPRWPRAGPRASAPGRRRRRPRTRATPRSGRAPSVSPAASVVVRRAGRELDELDAQRRARPHPRRGVARQRLDLLVELHVHDRHRLARVARPRRAAARTKPTRKPPTRTSLPFTSLEPVGSSALRL